MKKIKVVPSISCLFCNYQETAPDVVKHFKKEQKKDRHSHYVCSACLDWINYASKAKEE